MQDSRSWKKNSLLPIYDRKCSKLVQLTKQSTKLNLESKQITIELIIIISIYNIDQKSLYIQNLFSLLKRHLILLHNSLL